MVVVGEMRRWNEALERSVCVLTRALLNRILVLTTNPGGGGGGGDGHKTQMAREGRE